MRLSSSDKDAHPFALCAKTGSAYERGCEDVLVKRDPGLLQQAAARVATDLRFALGGWTCAVDDALVDRILD